MELKKVNKVVSKGYAKKDEISKKELKKFTPVKWLTASSIGLVTLLYTSPKNSIHKIGVVFGCISIAEPDYNYTILYHITNSIMDVFYYASWIIGIVFVLLLGRYIIKKKNYNEEKKKSNNKYLKVLATILIVCIIITSILIIVLKLDISAFYTNGIKQNLNDSYTNTDGLRYWEAIPESLEPVSKSIN